MVVNRDKAPTAQETFVQMAQAAGLRGRLLVTVGMLILVRLGIRIPIPGIDRDAFQQAVQGGALGSIVGLLDIFSGGGLSALGIFALGIIPFINASIIMQLMTKALPSLEDLQKNEGEAGRRKISQITRYVAAGWAIIQSTGLALFVSTYAENPGTPFIVETVLALTAGSMFVMWVGELITERGIGNGASLLIFVSIVSTLPQSLGNTFDLAQNGDPSLVGKIIFLILVFLAMIVGIVFVQEGTRRIPVISARRQVGRRMYQERSSYLPLRLNQGGVMPIIFTYAVLSLPFFLVNILPNNPILAQVIKYLSPDSVVYIILYLALILFFSYFYTSLFVDSVELSQNLKKMGSSIPGIRPGKATSDYIQKVLNHLTFLGAIFLGVLAIVPTAIEQQLGVTTFQRIGATSLLILVGVAIDTAKQIQTYVISQRYEGMVKQ
ncbi:MAG: preprotein translocase subunit SecY [Oscillatoriophycideae cyanobacterium NC_groundwater_1537_Pr4_S-0.65um_50_18]|nr:preprotein translocase subunit SecY [Oscillatoriophycideae cyanobacterium NC_groundwater_1537_Pr4_S-0.65um_50_18]